jgi:hypothetical protein
MQTTPHRTRAVFIQQWLVGLAMMVLLIPTAPSVVFGQPNPNPTGKVPSTVELPVEISIDIATGDDDTLPKPDITIQLTNEKSLKVLDLELPRRNAPSDHPSSAAAHAPFDTPPVATPPVTAPPFDTPPVAAPPVDTPPVATPPVTAPPFDVPPVATPPIDVPVADLPPVEAPTVEAPPVATPPVDVPAAGRP